MLHGRAYLMSSMTSTAKVHMGNISQSAYWEQKFVTFWGSLNYFCNQNKNGTIKTKLFPGKYSAFKPRYTIRFLSPMNLVTKVVHTPPKSDKFLFNMHTGKCHPYVGISLGYTSFCFSRLHWCWGEEVEGWCAAGVRGFLHLHLHIAQWKVPRTAILPYFKSYLL